MKPVFKNRPNKVYNVDGKEVWESRSGAVAAVILAIDKDKVFVLTEKRSQNMPDGAGMWACPSGYLDYDEDGWESMRREIYEETSFFVDEYEKYVVFDNNKDPWYTHTKPTENRQNIVLWYCIIYDFSKVGLPRQIESFKDKEIEKIKWMPLEKTFESGLKWAFNHDERIEQVIVKFKKYLT